MAERGSVGALRLLRGWYRLFGRPLSVALLVLSHCAQAQFSNLAVTDDGSRVYFATNLRLASESAQNLPSGAAIYSIGS